MTPASEMAYLSLERPWEENRTLMEKRRYSRYPLVGRDINDVRGVVHIKDLLFSDSAAPPHLLKIRRDLFAVQESAPLESVLDPLRSRVTNMAIVRNRAGQVVGVVTLEDVLEEIVGEIQDEYSPPRTHLLGQTLVPEAIDLQSVEGDRDAAYRALLKKLAAAVPRLDFQKTWKLILARELTLTSAVGRGVAIPHARVQEIDRPVLGLARLAKGLDFEAPDRKPVRLIFMILTPQNQPGSQVRLLARIAALVTNRTVLRSLLRARAPKEVLDVVTAFDQTMTD
jgi:mannitol/fructose-specific phosphotransferase system IIA component (Ntr-type)